MCELDIEARRARDLERHHRQTAERRARGLCVKCGKRPPEPGRTRCEPCAAKKRQQKERHAPPRTPCVVHCRAIENDCTPMAGEVEECRSIAPLRELGQTLLRNDPFGPDKVLHATVPLPCGEKA